MKPSQETYEDLNRLAQTGQSFDGRLTFNSEESLVLTNVCIGADQGLLNNYFESKWYRLSFSYNCTPSGSYE